VSPVERVDIVSEDLAGAGDADHIGVGRSGRIERRAYAIVGDESVVDALTVAVNSDGFAGGVDTVCIDIDVGAGRGRDIN
jgi:hypothetical protein